MTNNEAKEFPIPFGQYRGRPLDEIAELDPKYIDWLCGLNDIREPFNTALGIIAKLYAREIEEAVGDE